MAKPQSEIARQIQKRARILYFVFVLASFLIIGKIVYVQHGPEGDELREHADSMIFSRVPTPAERGSIISSDGRLMATSIPEYDVRMDFRADGLSDTLFANNVEELAKCLADFFGDRSYDTYLKLLSDSRKEATDDPRGRTNRYKLISPRRINHVEEKLVSSFPIFNRGPNRGGYLAVRREVREQPHGMLAKRTIGVVTADEAYKYGIEGQYDKFLRGVDGVMLKQRISGDFSIPVPDPQNREPVNGLDVVSTIDMELQDIAQSVLRDRLEETDADWGTVMLMQVSTGEIHAMANITRASPGVYTEEYNYAVGMQLEPGSTFKLATLMVLLEDAGMSLDRTFDCERGVAKIGIRRIRDDHPEGVISLRRVFEVSSNIGFAKAVNEVYQNDQGRFVDLIRSIGFGDPTGIDIPGENRPIVKHPAEKGTGWDKTSLSMMSHGYALRISPLQTLTFYNAIANNGVMVRPRLVRELRQLEKTVYTYKADTINPQVCSPGTLHLLKGCLEGVVERGTGRQLQNPYFSVAAKTGTAQIAQGRRGYTDADGHMHYLATMAGYFPADNPQYTCVVVMKTTRNRGGKPYHGAALSGPVFRKVMDKVYARKGFTDPRNNFEGPAVHTPDRDQIKNGPEDQYAALAARLKLPPYIGYIEYPETGPEPKPQSAEASDNTIYDEITAENHEGPSIPPVTGMGLKDALWELENAGFRVSFTGTGKVKQQSPEAGTTAAKGSQIILILG